MKNTFKKIIKGTIAIFAIKLVLVTGIFIFQSCETESIYNNPEEAKTNFLATLSQFKENLGAIKINNAKNSRGNNVMARDMQGTKETICLQFADSLNTPDYDVNTIVENIETVTELIQTKTTHNLITHFELNQNDDTVDPDDANTDGTVEDPTEPIYNPKDCVALIEISVQPVVDALNPSIQAAKDYLYNKGFNESEIDNFVSNDWNDSEEHLVPFVMYLATYEDYPIASNINYNNIFFNSAYAIQNVPQLTAPEIWDCAKEAAGWGFASAIGSKGLHKAGIKLLTKAFTKFVSRFAGPIGAAIMVADFSFCLYEAY